MVSLREFEPLGPKGAKFTVQFYLSVRFSKILGFVYSVTVVRIVVFYIWEGFESKPIPDILFLQISLIPSFFYYSLFLRYLL